MFGRNQLVSANLAPKPTNKELNPYLSKLENALLSAITVLNLAAKVAIQINHIRAMIAVVIPSIPIIDGDEVSGVKN